MLESRQSAPHPRIPAAGSVQLFADRTGAIGLGSGFETPGVLPPQWQTPLHDDNRLRLPCRQMRRLSVGQCDPGKPDRGPAGIIQVHVHSARDSNGEFFAPGSTFPHFLQSGWTETRPARSLLIANDARPVAHAARVFHGEEECLIVYTQHCVYAPYLRSPPPVVFAASSMIPNIAP